MIGPIRRLLRDRNPWNRPLSGGIWLMLGALDYFWMERPAHSPPLYFLMCGIGLTADALARMPLWRLLPISRRQLSLALWWGAIGQPMGLQVIVMGAAVLARILIKGPGVDWLMIVAFLSAQLAVRIGLGYGLIVTGHPSGTFNLPLAGVLLAVLAAILLLSTSTPAMAPVLLILGVLTLASAALSYRRALGGGLVQGAFTAPRPSTRSQAVEPERAGARGWSALALWVARAFGWIAIGFSAFILMDWILLARMQLPSQVASAQMTFDPIFVILGSAAITQRLTPRNLACLPVSRGGLTLCLILVNSAPTLASLALALVLSHYTASPPGLAPVLAVACGASALTLPIRLHFDRIAAMWITMLAFGVLTAAITTLAILGAGSSRDFQIIAYALAAVVLAASWAWTYAEIASGRRALRPRPELLLRWRSA